MNLFANLEVGDTLVRMLDGQLQTSAPIEGLDEVLIYCVGGWRLSRPNGAGSEEETDWNEGMVTGPHLLRRNAEQHGTG